MHPLGEPGPPVGAQKPRQLLVGQERFDHGVAVLGEFPPARRLDLHADAVESAQQLRLALEVERGVAEDRAHPLSLNHHAAGKAARDRSSAQDLGEDAVVHGLVPRQAGSAHLLGDEATRRLGRRKQGQPPVLAVAQDSALLAVLIERIRHGVVRIAVLGDLEQCRCVVDGFASHPRCGRCERTSDGVGVAEDRVAEHQIVRSAEKNTRGEQHGVDLPGAADHPPGRIDAFLLGHPHRHLGRREFCARDLDIVRVELHGDVCAGRALDQGDPTFGLEPRAHRRRARGARITARIPRCAPGCTRTRGRTPRGRLPHCGCRSGRCRGAGSDIPRTFRG